MQHSRSRNLFVAVWCAISCCLLILVLASLSSNDQAIVWRTLVLGICASALAVPLGMCMAWIACGKGTVAAMVRVCCVVGVLIPVFVQVSAWDAAFGKLGVLTNTFGEVLKPLVSRWPAAVWIHSMIAAPQVAIIFLVSIRSGSQAWEDALRLEATAMAATMRVVRWRYLPVVTAASLWTIISCSREIGVTDIYQIGTLSEQVYLGYSLGQLNAIGIAWTPEQLLEAQNLGLGVSVLVFAWLAISAIFVFFSVLRTIDRSETYRPPVPKLGGVFSRIVGLAVLVVVVAVPVANLTGRVGFSVTRIDGEPVAVWNASSAMEAIRNVLLNFRDEFVWSFLIAGVAATVICLIALTLAFLCQRSMRGKILAGLVFGGLAAVPGPSIGLFVGSIFSQFDWAWVQYLYDRTIVAPVIANVLFCLPVAIPVFFFLASQTPKDQLQHATIEGVSPLLQFLQFSLLGNWQSNLGAWFLIAALSFGELSATQMVLPPGMDSVPRLALGMLHAGVNESTAALTLITLCPVILFCVLAQICFAGKRRLRLE